MLKSNESRNQPANAPLNTDQPVLVTPNSLNLGNPTTIIEYRLCLYYFVLPLLVVAGIF
jgi:hypothetical protein